MAPSILIAIGGGGATHGDHPELDRFCLSFLPPRPRLGFVGAASDDAAAKFERFCAAFHAYSGGTTCLPAGADGSVAGAWAAELDMIYVGGGDPTALTARWPENGVAKALVAASRRGAVIAGVSAGAMCWFDSFLWRAPHGGLQAARGLGYVRGAMTPHSLEEPERRAHLLRLVAAGDPPFAFAVDDGAALALRDGRPAAVFPPAGPPFVYRMDRTAPESAVETVVTAADPPR